MLEVDKMEPLVKLYCCNILGWKIEKPYKTFIFRGYDPHYVEGLKPLFFMVSGVQWCGFKDFVIFTLILREMIECDYIFFFQMG